MSYISKPIFFFEPANSTSQIKKAMLSFLDSWLQKHSSKDELKLYHYTTLDGLKGIIKNRSIWLTHISNLNDPLELKYGEDLILDLIQKASNEESDENIIQLLKYLSDFVKSFNSATHQTYVACFCEAENLLSQWRAYGARGGGYNLGFGFGSNTKFSHSLGENADSYVLLRKIVYDFEEQKGLISNYISSIIRASHDAIKYFKENSGIPDAWSAIAATEAVNILFDLKLSFKNPVFAEENEWRLIKGRQTHYKPEQIKFRESKDGFIPFIETFLYEETKDKKVFPLSSIKFGPTLDEDKTKPGLKLFLFNESVADNMIELNANNISVTGAGYVLRD